MRPAQLHVVKLPQGAVGDEPHEGLQEDAMGDNEDPFEAPGVVGGANPGEEVPGAGVHLPHRLPALGIVPGVLVRGNAPEVDLGEGGGELRDGAAAVAGKEAKGLPHVLNGHGSGRRRLVVQQLQRLQRTPHGAHYGEIARPQVRAPVPPRSKRLLPSNVICG